MPVFQAAAVQFEPRQFDKARNLDRLRALVSEAALGGARLIVTPEMGTTGYCWFDRDEVSSEVEPVPGPTTDRFHALAREHDCYIVIGMPEVDPASGLYYNSAVLIGPDGVIGTHRKTHPYIAEPKWSAPGDLGHRVFDTPIGRIAMLICMDIHFIETARLAALAGADVICHISNWLAERTPAPYWIQRAFENGCYLVESNRWGLERTVQFSGGSCVIEPDGRIAAVVDRGDGIAIATIDTDRSRRREVLGEPVFAQRRPALYTGLVANPFAWNPADYYRLYGDRPIPSGSVGSVAVVQLASSPDVAANLARIDDAVAALRASDRVDLVVFPELCVTGLDDPGARAQPIGGSAVDALLRIAARHRTMIVAGLAERDGAERYNTAVMAGPAGLMGAYRKIHLTRADRQWAQAGDRWTFVDTPLGRVGLLIGHDASFPESGRLLALQGCDLIACPASESGRLTGAHAGSLVRQNHPIPTGRDPLHWHAMRVRAGENNVYFAFANAASAQAGESAYSGVFGPDTFAFPRSEAVVLTPTGTAVATIDTTTLPGSAYPTSAVRNKDLVRMRLPHHYKPLVS